MKDITYFNTFVNSSIIIYHNLPQFTKQSAKKNCISIIDTIMQSHHRYHDNDICVEIITTGKTNRSSHRCTTMLMLQSVEGLFNSIEMISQQSYIWSDTVGRSVFRDVDFKIFIFIYSCNLKKSTLPVSSTFDSRTVRLLTTLISKHNQIDRQTSDVRPLWFIVDSVVTQGYRYQLNNLLVVHTVQWVLSARS